MNSRKPALIIIFLLLALAGTSGGSNAAQAQDAQNKAGLVLQFPDGTTQTYCIPFDGDTISGFDLLLKTGLQVKVQAYGGLGVEVCQIGDTGCNYPDQPCACQSYGPGGVYWSYHHLKNGKWVASVVGAGSYKVHNGDVEGWAWSDGKPPALYTFSQLCPAAAPQPAPTSTPKPPHPTEPPATPVPPTATRRPPASSPTHKPQPTATLRPVAPQPPQIQSTLALTEQPRPSPTNTTIPTTTPTIPSTLTATSTATLQPTSTPAIPSPTPTIRNPRSAIRNQEDVARAIGLAIGGVVLGSLAVWGIVTALRRTRNGGDTDVE